MNTTKLAAQESVLTKLISSLEDTKGQESIERQLADTFMSVTDPVTPNSNGYYSVLNCHLYQNILKHYKHQEEGICLWRYIKNLPADQLNTHYGETNSELKMLDHLIRIYFYSDPLDDLTCLFIPVSDGTLIRKYLDWIKNYFYDVNYPTSLLWLYALDSSLASLFPDEIIYLGKRLPGEAEDIIIPDFDYQDTVILKRYSEKPGHYVQLYGENANSEFRQIFTFLGQEYKDRCLSRSGKQEEDVEEAKYDQEWEKFEDVLRFGVSDKTENGCISFSDLRSSTEFLNTYGKNVYLNQIQQPFFENTKLISKKYKGRIDKFMGDNVMCVFLNGNMDATTRKERETEAILNNLFALFSLCRILYTIILEQDFTASNLGLRSGVTYGKHILRSNLGNELVRDFTVTGETVNLAARLEHISIQELIIHNQNYFENSIERFPQIRELLSIDANQKNLNPESTIIVQDFTLYQNILSNLQRLEKVKFDIRFNQEFYLQLKDHLINKGYQFLNPDTARMYGFEKFNIEGHHLTFYFSYYNPKGFNQFEKIWILPLDIEVLTTLDIEKIR